MAAPRMGADGRLGGGQTVECGQLDSRAMAAYAEFGIGRRGLAAAAAETFHVQQGPVLGAMMLRCACGDPLCCRELAAGDYGLSRCW